MTTLQEALQSLGPTNWESIPHTSSPKLRAYVDDLTKKATLVVNSVPEPPAAPKDTSSTSSSTATGPGSQPSSQITLSAHRTGTNDPHLTSLQHEWGKPLKVGIKDNPLSVPVYKLSGADGRGAWFARRSVHEGLGFGRWREKAEGEFGETLRVNRGKMEKGEMPDYAVRGIGAEKVLEEVDVLDAGAGADGNENANANGNEEKEVVASMKVFLVSAVFPGPTTPRDFVPLVVTCDVEGGLNGVRERKGRCWMVVSKPCLHDGAPERDGYIRGQYESVEFIREIPRPSGDSGTGRKRGDTESSSKDQGQDDDEEDINPVEWIMITRSDPGGSIPRWIVEKGTPKGICSDTVKFLNWACRDDDSNQPDRTLHERSSLEDDDNGNDEDESEDDNEDELDESTSESDDTDTEYNNGLVANVAYMLNAGLDRFIPQAVLDYMPYTYGPPRGIPDGIDIPITTPADKESETPTNEPKRSLSDKASLTESTDSGVATPVENGDTPAEATKKKKLSSHEKQLIKLAQKKQKYETKLDTLHSEMESLNLNISGKGEIKSPQADSERASNTSGAGKQESPSPAPSRPSRANAEKAQKHKAASGLFHNESKLLKRLAKIERDQLKVAEKMEVRQRKATERENKSKSDSKSRSRSDVDSLRREVDALKKDVESLRDERQKWLGLVKSLQDENMKLTKGGGE